MWELVFRFVVGGAMVCLFASLGDVFKPQSFGGLFGAAPSIALATLALTLAKEGNAYATTEAHSMIAGAVALFAYAYGASWLMMRRRFRGIVASSLSILVWAAAAFGLWFAWWGRT